MSSLASTNDSQVTHYLMATWAKVCQAMGQEFEPYLPVVMPSLLATAGAKADLSLYGKHLLFRQFSYLSHSAKDNDDAEEREGWETIVMDGQTCGIKTSAMEEKCQAFETLVIYCSTLGPRFAPYLSQTLEVTLPCLKFYFHEGVREACAMYVAILASVAESLTYKQAHTPVAILRKGEWHSHEPNGVRHLPPAHQ